MKKRKLIALITSEIYDGYQNRMIEGVMAQAYALDYNIVIFSVISMVDLDIPMCIGQDLIYKLINFDLIDGVIFASETFRCDPPRDRIKALLKEKCKKPVVELADQGTLFPLSSIDDVNAFEKITKHLIEQHDSRLLYCLTGFDCFESSHKRAEGFLNALREKSLPITSNTVTYGDFWSTSAIELANKIINGVIPKPDAVVCANDIMAINLCNTLCENGILVPHDIMITGYDGISEAMDNVPAITTYWRPLFSVGANGVCMIHKMITGEDVTSVADEVSDIIPGESCGCHRHNSYVLDRVREERLQKKYSIDYDCSFMSQVLTSTNSPEECFDKIDNLTYLINGLETYALCLCDDWKYIANEKGCYDKLPKKIHLEILKIQSTRDIEHQGEFDTKLMLPQLWEDRDYPTSFFITPINFNERFFGYSALSYGRKMQCYDKIYQNWNLDIGNALEYVYSQERLKSLYNQLYLASLRDSVTGIYNRTGFTKYATEAFDKARELQLPLLAVSADLDKLKYINDTFGHAEGDNAIKIASQALNAACLENEICARTGGDEFAVIGTGIYDAESIAEEFKNRVYSYLERINKQPDKKYNVELSIGIYCGIPLKTSQLKEITDYTDKIMYADKKKRKAEREK